MKKLKNICWQKVEYLGFFWSLSSVANCFFNLVISHYVILTQYSRSKWLAQITVLLINVVVISNRPAVNKQKDEGQTNPMQWFFPLQNQSAGDSDT